MDEKVIDDEFKWLNELVVQIPMPIRRKKTVFEIAGFPKWENVNSNILGFYLDETEEHGFGRLFLDSLLLLLRKRFQLSYETKELFETKFQVDREFLANGKRIDILIRERNDQGHNSPHEYLPKWAIIIENKLDADLYNDLETYWRSVRAELKIGIVLSLKDLSGHPAIGIQAGRVFWNVLHTDFIEVIKSELSHVFLEAEDRHLLLLKDYLQNVKNMAPTSDDLLFEKQLQILHSYNNQIDKLEEVQRSLKDYSAKAVFKAFATLGYFPLNSSTNVEQKHFYPDETFFKEKDQLFPRYFRFYAYLDYIVVGMKIWIIFELYEEYAKYGSLLKERLSGTPVNYPGKIATRGGDQYKYHQLSEIVDYHLSDRDKTIEVQVAELLRKVYFQDSMFNISHYVFLATEAMDKIVAEEAAGK